MLDEDDVIILTDENGEDITFEPLDQIEYGSETYLVLMEEGDEDVVTILQEDGEGGYVTILDTDILDTIFNLFKERNKDRYDFD